MSEGTDEERRAALAELFGATREDDPEVAETAEPEPTEQADQQPDDVELLRRLHAEPEKPPVPESTLRRRAGTGQGEHAGQAGTAALGFRKTRFSYSWKPGSWGVS